MRSTISAFHLQKQVGDILMVLCNVLPFLSHCDPLNSGKVSPEHNPSGFATTMEVDAVEKLGAIPKHFELRISVLSVRIRPLRNEPGCP